MHKLDFYTALIPFILAVPALIFKSRKRKPMSFQWSGHQYAIFFAVIAGLNLAGSIAPPTEADSLAYHFNLPKIYAEAGGIVFQAHAIAYASTFMSQLISTGAYIIGGEAMMTLHAWFSSLMAGIAVYALARRRLRPAPSWVFAALMYSVPALTYGASNGVVEPRLMGVIVTAALALVYYARSEKLGWLVVLSILMGGALGLKYFGMFTVFAFGVALIFVVKTFPFRKSIPHLFIFGILTLIFGAEWYWWNWHHTGDPVFPSLYHLMGKQGWSAEQAAYFKEHYLSIELMIERTKSNFFWGYPIEVTFNGGGFDSGRTGLGAIFLIALIPSVLWFLKRFPFMTWNAHVGALELYMLIFIIVYALFFFVGPSGRVRHLLPVLPLLSLPAWVWGQQIIARTLGLPRTLMLAGVLALLGAQTSMVLMANKNAIAFWAKNTTEEDYLRENAHSYALATYINENLTKSDKIMFSNLRTLNYHVDIPRFHAAVRYQEIIPLSYATTSENLNAIWREGITHWATRDNPLNPSNDLFDNGHHVLRHLIELGCFKQVGELEGYIKLSRSLDDLGGRPVTYYVYKAIPRCAG